MKMTTFAVALALSTFVGFAVYAVESDHGQSEGNRARGTAFDLHAAAPSAQLFADADSGSSKAEDKSNPKHEQSKSGKKSSADKLDRGIGPIDRVVLDSINADMVARGKELFGQKCMVCHQLDTRKIGPPLRDVTKQQTPEFIMNMILNPTGMEAKNATIKKLISQYQTYMSISGITKSQARDLLEYLRWAAEQAQ